MAKARSLTEEVTVEPEALAATETESLTSTIVTKVVNIAGSVTTTTATIPVVGPK